MVYIIYNHSIHYYIDIYIYIYIYNSTHLEYNLHHLGKNHLSLYNLYIALEVPVDVDKISVLLVVLPSRTCPTSAWAAAIHWLTGVDII